MRRASWLSLALGLAVVTGLIAYLSISDHPPEGVEPRENSDAGTALRIERVGPASDLKAGVRVIVDVRGLVGHDTHAASGAEVQFIGGVDESARADPHRIRALTDKDGRARVALPSDGVWLIGARAVGYYGTSQQFRLVDGQRAEYEIDLEVVAIPSLGGVLTDLAGNPVEGAMVRLIVPPEENPALAMIHPEERASGWRHEFFTDGAGRYTIPVAPVDADFRVQFAARERGRCILDVDALVAGESRVLNAKLDAPAHITGRVPPPWDLPKGSSTVECWLHGAGPNELKGEQRVYVEDDGSFTIVNVEPGEKTLSFIRVHENRMDISFANCLAVRGETTDVGELAVAPSSVRVTVIADVDGSAERFVRLSTSITDLEPPHSIFPFPATIPLGVEYEFRGVPAGGLQFSAKLLLESGTGTDTAYSPAFYDEPFDGSAAVIQVPLLPSDDLGTPVGTVLAPPPGVTEVEFRVRAMLVRDGLVVHAMGSSISGSTVVGFGPQPRGTYEVLALANGYAGRSPEVSLGGSGTAQAPITQWRPCGLASGVVRDAQGEATQGANVALMQVRPDNGLVKVLWDTKTDDQGLFEVPSVPELEHLFVQAWTDESSSARIEVSGDDRRTGLSLNLVAR